MLILQNIFCIIPQYFYFYFVNYALSIQHLKMCFIDIGLF